MPADSRPDLPRPMLPHPRRALSEVRSVVRHGLGIVRHGIDNAPLPAPVAAITGSVLRKVDDLAHHADAVARTLVDGLLGPATPAGDVAAMSAALAQSAAGIGPALLRVNDIAVAKAVGTASTENPEAAALLMRRLVEADAVRPAGRAASVAIFSAVLARLNGSHDPESVSACMAIAEALSDEIAAAGTAVAPLARLFAEFRDHV